MTRLADGSCWGRLPIVCVCATGCMVNTVNKMNNGSDEFSPYRHIVATRCCGLAARRILCRAAPTFRYPLVAHRHRVSEKGMAGIARNTLRSNYFLRQISFTHRYASCSQGRCQCQRGERHIDFRPMPPRNRQRQLPHRLCRRPPRQSASTLP